MKTRIFLFGMLLCYSNSVLFAAEPVVVAQVGSSTITEGELDEQAKGALEQIEREAQKVKLATLKGMIEKQLVKLGAQGRGMSVEDFEKSIKAQAMPVTEEDIKKEYQEISGPGKEDLEKIKDGVRDYLKHKKEMEAWQKELQALRKEYKVKILMPVSRVEVKEAKDPIAKGPEKAPIQIIFFSDFECVYCNKGNETLTEVMKNNPDKIRLTYRDFPLGFHGNAVKASEAARCAREQGKFWEYYELLFKNSKALDLESLKKYAVNLKLEPVMLQRSRKIRRKEAVSVSLALLLSL